MDVSGQLDVPVTLPPAKGPHTPGWASKAGRDPLEKDTFFCPCLEFNHISSVAQPVI
jgi:hypothetical protein